MLQAARLAREVRRHQDLLRADPVAYLRRLERGVKLRFFRNLYLDLGNSLEDTVLVAGSGRSGTTWLGDVINYDDSYRTIFEPFNPSRVKTWEPFGSRRYVRPNNADEQLHSTVRRILAGEIRNSWADCHNRAFIATKRIVKEISINNMLGYLEHRFPQIRIVYILRHPFAVAQSRLRLGWDTYPDPTVKTDLSVFTRQQALMDDYLEPFREKLEQASSPFAKEVAFWAAENYAPLQQLRGSKSARIVFYEALVLKPQETLPEMMSFVGRSFNERAEKVAIRPSGTSAREATVSDREKDLVASWKKRGDLEVQEGLAILKTMQLDQYYDMHPLPVPLRSDTSAHAKH